MTLVELERNLNRAQKLVHTQSGEALNLAFSARDFARSVDQPKLEAKALCICALATFNFGNNEDTLAYLAELTQLAELYNIGEYEGRTYSLYAQTQYTLSAYHLSRDSWNRCLTLPDSAIDLETRVQAHIGLGQLYYAHEHFQSALAHHRKAEDLAAGSEDYHLQGAILINIGADLIACEQLDEAFTVLKGALPLVRADQSYRNEAEIYMHIGRIQLLRGELDRSKMSLMVALKINRLHIHQWSEANTLLTLGECHIAKGEYSHAIEELTMALTIATALGALHLQSSIHSILAKAFLAMGEADSAEQHQAAHLNLRQLILAERHESQLETMELNLV
ncbi:MAG: tetratricopeptide repeat protein [Deefgea sp.]